MKNLKQRLSLSLVFFFMLTLFQGLGISVQADEAALRSPVLNSNGTITFNFQGDDTVTRAVVRGEFSNWDNKSMTKGENNVWSYTTDAAVRPGIYKYGIEKWSGTANGEWQYDPLNPVKNADDDNAMLVINPIINADNSVTFNYAGSGTENKIIVKGSFNGWKAVELSKVGSTNLWSKTLDIEPGSYEYGFAVWTPSTTDNGNGDWKSDPFNSSKASNGNAVLEVQQLDVVPDKLIDQPGAKSRYVIAGSFQGWNPNSTETQLKHLVGGFYQYSRVLDAGKHEFKIVKNGNWDDPGTLSNNGRNFIFELSEKTKVNFYVNEDINKARINLPNVEGLQQYIPSLNSTKWPRLVGTIQTLFANENTWSPETARQLFVDYNFDGSIYKLQRSIPAGTYEVKVAFGPNWNESYGDPQGPDGNMKLVTLDPSDVTFTIDYSGDKKLTHDYKPKDGGFDGQIKRDGLYFDSRSITYKKPFGAIRVESEDLTLRIAAEKGDVQIAKLELINGKGVASSYDMRKATTVGDKEYFEVTIPKAKFNELGIWGYKFILIDGSTKVEYGDAGVSGGTGAAVDEGAIPFNLTVYAKDFKTPDWMKGAVVYQIFPDRFFDGNKDNNRAKVVDGYRGRLDSNGNPVADKLQYFDGGVSNDPAEDQVWGRWQDHPENPRHAEPQNRPYYPESRTDNLWSNEFYGGDIQGIEEKLGYLKSIGVTAIYLNPAAWAASNHKYDATDYKHLDPMFGQPVYNRAGDPTSGLNYEATRAASDRVYIAFAKAARAKGIYIIADGVFNHVGDDSIYFDRYEKYPEIGAYEYWKRVWDKVNAGKTQAQAETEVRNYYTSKVNPVTNKNYAYPEDFEFTTWFTVENSKRADGSYKYDSWWGFDSLPVMDAKEPQAGDELAISGQHEWNNVNYRDDVIGFDLTGLSAEEAEKQMKFAASQRWIWMGARGWRLDVAPDVSTETWIKFREAVKSTTGRLDANGEVIDDPIILGEEWGVATHYLLGDQFDSVMNYQFRAAVQNFIIKGDAAAFNEALEVIRENYPKEAWEVMLNLVDSHDTIRNITKIDNPTWEEENTRIAPEASDKALKLQALTAIMQMSYPGAPMVYYGDEVGVTGTKDPDSRRSFPWERVQETNGNYSAVGKFAPLFNVYQKAASIRNENLELFADGEMRLAYASGDVIAYARRSANKGGLVVINRGDEAKAIVADVSSFLPDGTTLKDNLYGTLTTTVEQGKISINVPAQTGYMLVSEGTFTVVPAVNNLTAEAKNGSVELSWRAVEGATSYKVYRTNLEGERVTLIGTAAEISYSDNNVVNGSRYYYYVTAVKGTGESELSEVASALPAFEIESVALIGELSEVVIGVGNTTGEIKAEFSIPGLTDNSEYTGKEVPNVIARLVYYKDGTNKAFAVDTKLRYKGDASGKKVYYAAFEPTEAGIYNYFAKISTNNGETFVASAEKSVTAKADTRDTQAPNSPVVADITVESNRVELNWTFDGDDAAGFEVFRSLNGIDFIKVTVLENNKRSYIDYTVSNDTQYSYKIAAFDSVYNRGFSGVKSVTPTLVMVDVTLRLHIPEYTPATDDIYIAGTLNGWNASGGKLTVPSGATKRDIVEYSFKMMAGKSIEYKYTRGSWSTEAFTSHIRRADDTVDYGNWAYSSTDTNMRLTIRNQGGNKMLVEDFVLRWVDMPMMVSMPRISYGDNIEFTTNEDKFTLKAKVPFGVAFTINDEDISKYGQNAMNELGDVYVENIPLKAGENIFTLHIEPTEETLALPWYTDQGRKGQATKTITMKITRNASVENPGNGGDTPTTPTTPSLPETTSITNTNPAAVISAINSIASNGKVVVDVTSNKSVAKEIFDAIKGTDKTVTFTQNGVEWSFDGKNITGSTKAVDMTVNVAALGSTNSGNKAAIAEKVNNENVLVISFAKNGQLPGKAKVRVKLDAAWLAGKNKNNINIYYYNETTKAIETIASALVVDSEGYVQFDITHNSDYIIADKDLTKTTAPTPEQPKPAAVVRLGGSNRYETSVKVSQAGWTTADNVVLARGDEFADALTAAPFAKQLNAPILLTSTKALDASVIAELKRLKTKKIYIIGGTGAISASVENTVKAMGITVERISGSDRYATSLAVANRMTNKSQVFLATGTNFADALSISSYAAATGSPILLTAKNQMTAGVAKFIKDNNSKVYVIGGTGVISEAAVKGIAGAERIAGADRYATNLAVLSKFASGYDFANIYLATGANYPDAICGSVLAGKEKAPIILVNNSSTSGQNTFVKSIIAKVKKINVLGGEGVVTQNTVKSIID